MTDNYVGDAVVLQQEAPDFLGEALADMILIIPRLIGAFIILLLGWIIGRLLARVIRRIAATFDLGTRTMSTPIGEMLGSPEAVAGALGKVGAYYIYFLALLAAADVLQIPLISMWISDAASYLPALIAGVLLIVTGFIVADFIGGVIQRTEATTQQRHTQLLADGVRVFLYFIVLVLGLDTMGVSVEILYIFAAALAGGLGLALAIGIGIAVGLGGKEFVADNLDRWAGRASDEVGGSGSGSDTRDSGPTDSDTD